MTATSTGLGTTGVDDSALDNPSWSALTGAHAHLAEGDDLARRYPADVSPITGVRSWTDPGVWDATAALVGPGGHFSAPPVGVEPPRGWTVEARVEGVQLVETERLVTRPDRRPSRSARTTSRRCSRSSSAADQVLSRHGPTCSAGTSGSATATAASSPWRASASGPPGGPRSAP